MLYLKLLSQFIIRPCSRGLSCLYRIWEIKEIYSLIFFDVSLLTHSCQKSWRFCFIFLPTVVACRESKTLQQLFLSKPCKIYFSQLAGEKKTQKLSYLRRYQKHVSANRGSFPGPECGRKSLNESEGSPFAVSPGPQLHLDTGAGLALLRQFCFLQRIFFVTLADILSLRYAFQQNRSSTGFSKLNSRTDL